MNEGMLNRARLLGAELYRAGQSLGQHADAITAAVFVSDYARCSRYPEDIQQAAGISQIVQDAKVGLEAHRSEFEALLLAGVRPEHLLSEASMVATRKEGALGWGLEVLFFAETIPFLPVEAQEKQIQILERVLSWLQSHPYAFLDTLKLAVSRSDFEEPPPVGSPAAQALQAFEDVVIEALLEEEALVEASAEALSILERTVRESG